MLLPCIQSKNGKRNVQMHRGAKNPFECCSVYFPGGWVRRIYLLTSRAQDIYAVIPGVVTRVPTYNPRFVTNFRGRLAHLSLANRMSLLSRICRVVLVTHGLINIAQGIYSLVSPKGYGDMTGDLFAGSPDMALGSIGGVHPIIVRLINTDVPC